MELMIEHHKAMENKSLFHKRGIDKAKLQDNRRLCFATNHAGILLSEMAIQPVRKTHLKKFGIDIKTSFDIMKIQRRCRHTASLTHDRK